MKKSAVLTFVAGAALLFAAPAATQAQYIWVGGGAAIPTGDFGDVASTGVQGVVGIGFPLGESGFGIGVEGSYGSNSLEGDDTDGSFNPLGLMGGIGYRVGDPENLGIYLFGQGGLLSVDPPVGDSESAFGYAFGAGVDIPVGESVGVWIEGRFTGSGDLGEGESALNANFFSILAGLGFGLG